MKLIRDLMGSRIVTGATLLVALFWLVAAFVPPITMIQLMNFLVLAVAIAVTVSYAPGVWRAVREDRTDRLAQLGLGITLAWVSIVLNRGWNAVMRFTHSEWMETHIFIAFCIYLSILAATLHITAPGALDGRIPRRNLVMLGVAVGIGVTGFTMLALSSWGVELFPMPAHR
ncbi:MAG TPA: hypothetical protein VGN97_21915 [Mesorhizobium sp.]|nr:hypothetical protein [Mesorhizobium sp.]